MLEILEQQSTMRNSEPILRNADWRIEYDFDKSGAHHMHRDEALAREYAENGKCNVLRLYSWSPASVSIGYQQKLESIDLDACARRGIDVVHRPTGGRAVLHCNELTYAVIMRTDPRAGIYAAHNRIVDALISSLACVGAEYTQLAITGRSADAGFSEVYQAGKLTNAACFASTARHEATYRGRKVIGSAQRRFGDVLLQHGSILLTEDHLALPELLNLSDERRQQMSQLLRAETSTLSEVFGRDLAPEDVAYAIGQNMMANLSLQDR